MHMPWPRTASNAPAGGWRARNRTPRAATGPCRATMRPAIASGKPKVCVRSPSLSPTVHSRGLSVGGPRSARVPRSRQRDRTGRLPGRPARRDPDSAPRRSAFPARRIRAPSLDAPRPRRHNPASRHRAQVAQLVEHVTENHGVGGSIPSLGTNQVNNLHPGCRPDRAPLAPPAQPPGAPPKARARTGARRPRGVSSTRVTVRRNAPKRETGSCSSRNCFATIAS